ncbi:MAG: hypothetical protein ACK47B_25955 [Armatimonadota bacterium]
MRQGARVRRVGAGILGVAALAAVLAGGLVPEAGAAPKPKAGKLDQKFGQGGRAIQDFSRREDGAEALAIQADGKIVVAGTAQSRASATQQLRDFALLRCDSRGRLDPGFGARGRAVLDFDGYDDSLSAVELVSGGKILAAGTSVGPDAQQVLRHRFALARFTPSGALDSEFGSGGRVTADLTPGDDEIYALAVLPDGSILAAGQGRAGASDDFALAKFTPDGQLDPEFGDGGRVLTDFSDGSASSDEARAVIALPGGRILVAGTAHNDFALARYEADGSLDPSFGDGGRVVTDLRGGADRAYGMALQADGMIVVAGSALNGKQGLDLALARYSAEGVPDATFGDGGTVVGHAGGDEAARAIAVQADGRLVVAGSALPRRTVDTLLARYHPDGTLDATFGKQGVSVLRFSKNSHDYATAVRLQGDGKIVFAGATRGKTPDFLVGRVLAK